VPGLGGLDPADVAKLWALVSELPGSQFIPRSQLIRLTGFIPADLAARLLRLLDGGPELVGTQAARIRTAIDPHGPPPQSWPWLWWAGWRPPHRSWLPGAAPRSWWSCLAWPTGTARPHSPRTGGHTVG